MKKTTLLLALSFGASITLQAQTTKPTKTAKPAAKTATTMKPDEKVADVQVPQEPVGEVPHPVLPLYSGSIPDSKPSGVQETSVTESAGVRISTVIQPTLTVYLPTREKANGTSVIICPGGGYARLAIDHEGYDVAKRLN